ncbi:hypothetical protein RIF29_20335 [Crotalaria pallida]|uniref:Uncharacterized protein n=1 Tax=Crotalaria pallida TaxID=3830 RepID=A0AAN9F1E0_CROPI
MHGYPSQEYTFDLRSDKILGNQRNFTENEKQLRIHRSRSVPEFSKDDNVPAGGIFRIIPITPQLAEKTTRPTTSATSRPDGNDVGNP